MLEILLKNRIALCTTVLFFQTVSCTKNTEKIAFSGSTMGTTYSVQIAESSNINKDYIKRDVEKTLSAVNQQMSTYIKDSEISELNKNDSLKPFKVSPWFYEVLDYSLKLAEKTGGAYDPTVGPLVNLWGFGPQSDKAVPDEKTINDTKPFVGYDKLTLVNDGEGVFFVKKVHPKVYVDLSSSAKGFAVDKIAENLEKKAITNYFVEVGGEIKARGTKFKDHWTVAIEEPNPSKRAAFKSFHLNDLSIATSGSYRNYFEENNVKYSHTIDSRTGKPVVHSMVSVTVLEERCMKADALATALMVMGPEKAKVFSEKNKLMVYFIYKPPSSKDKGVAAFKTYSSKAFTSNINVLN